MPASPEAKELSGFFGLPSKIVFFSSYLPPTSSAISTLRIDSLEK